MWIEEADRPRLARRPSSIIFTAKERGRSAAISFFRSRIGYSNGNDSRVSRNFSLSLSLSLRFVRALDSVRTANEGGEEREGGVVVSIQMRKFRIYTARQAIISGARNVGVVFFAELLSRSNGSWSVKRSLLDRCYLGFNTESRTGPR